MTDRNTIRTLKFIVTAVKERAAKGMTLMQIAADMAMPYQTAYNIAKHNKIEVMDGRGVKSGHDKKTLLNRAISTLYHNGWTAKEVSQVMGVGVGRVYQIVRDVAPTQKSNDNVPAGIPADRIDIKETIRETAIANRGKASASQIAEACGVSRNSIIGHWGRALRSGQLQAAE